MNADPVVKVGLFSAELHAFRPALIRESGAKP
jgi:hypothetical protein